MPSEMERLCQLEEENGKLKMIVAGLSPITLIFLGPVVLAYPEIAPSVLWFTAI